LGSWALGRLGAWALGRLGAWAVQRTQNFVKILRLLQWTISRKTKSYYYEINSSEIIREKYNLIITFLILLINVIPTKNKIK
jgi:hypothetical protein